MAVDSKQVQAVFSAVCDMADDAARASALDLECGGDQPLRERVEALLRAHEAPGSLHIDRPSALQPNSEVNDLTGTVIAGRYTLREQLGEGGMGVVWEAEQREPVKRLVAVKLVKPGMDSRSVLARFEAERQALAIMDHPNIARVLDGGATESGRPFFVMELVRGQPVTDHCDQFRLSPNDRLALFVTVCHAVQHAHQKGVIHRDLKPSNIMVSMLDGHPIVKVIDFGVAKAIAAGLEERATSTHLGQVIGTPLYMSPEQAGIEGMDIDTRTDVYSLGVLLYELLTGTTPFDKQRLHRAAIDEIRRVIREEDPPKPSTRLSHSGDTLPAVAAQRKVEPGKLSKLIRGDLDWITMKALEKDRARRYETANGLAMDIMRYLADEPVSAGPPSSGYRLRKFVRRNQGKVMAASVMVALLLAGVVGTGLGLIRAEGQRKIAEANAESARAAAVAAKAAQEVAETKQRETEAVVEFVQNHIFSAAGPKGNDHGLGHDVTLRKALEAALPHVDKSFASQPLIEARLRKSLGQGFEFLGQAAISAKQFDRARTIYAKHLGPEHVDTLSSMHGLANAWQNLGRFQEACDLREETFAVQKRVLGPEHVDTLRSMHNLSISYVTLGRRKDAFHLQEEVLALRKRVLGPNHFETFSTMTSVANSLEALGRHQQALDIRQKTLALQRAHPRLGPKHPDTLLTLTNVANSHVGLLRFEEALKISSEAYELRKDILGVDHPDTLVSAENVASINGRLNRHDDQLKLLADVLGRRKVHPTLGPNHPDTQRAMRKLALVHVKLLQHEEALAVRQELWAIQKTKHGADHKETLECMDDVASSLFALGRGPEAIRVIDECMTRTGVVFHPQWHSG